jgi:hypothetical protein
MNKVSHPATSFPVAAFLTGYAFEFTDFIHFIQIK